MFLGKEVAKFVKLKYPDLLLKLESFQKGDYIQALKESFHGIDQLLEDEVSCISLSSFVVIVAFVHRNMIVY